MLFTETLLVMNFCFLENQIGQPSPSGMWDLLSHEQRRSGQNRLKPSLTYSSQKKGPNGFSKKMVLDLSHHADLFTAFCESLNIYIKS